MMSQLFLEDLLANDSGDEQACNGIILTHFPCVVGRHSDCD
jgi:hypothetical protein